MGKKKHEEHENHERWLVSYADFITLLFAFFTVLYATSQTDQNKMKEISKALNAALEGGLDISLVEKITGWDAPEGYIPDAPMLPTRLHTESSSDQVMKSIRKNLDGSLSDNVVQLGLIDQNLVIELPEAFFFRPGSAEINPLAYPELNKIATSLVGQPASLNVLGQADATPVQSGGGFKDNWELASARSIAVTRYLVSKGLDPNRIQIAGRVNPSTQAQARSVQIRVEVDAPAAGAEVRSRLESEDAPAPAAQPPADSAAEHAAEHAPAEHGAAEHAPAEHAPAEHAP